MKQISMEDLLIVTFVLIDDWCKSEAYHKPHIGRKAEMTDSEVLTLILAMDFVEFTSERHYLEFIRANYKYLFPDLLDQSQYNRRVRSVVPLLESLRLAWANKLGLAFERYFLKENQKKQLPRFVQRVIGGLRERIEGVYKIAKEGGRTIEHNFAHTLGGLISRILGKIAGLTLRHYLRDFLGIDVMTYRQAC